MRGWRDCTSLRPPESHALLGPSILSDFFKQPHISAFNLFLETIYMGSPAINKVLHLLKQTSMVHGACSLLSESLSQMLIHLALHLRNSLEMQLCLGSYPS